MRSYDFPHTSAMVCTSQPNSTEREYSWKRHLVDEMIMSMATSEITHTIYADATDLGRRCDVYAATILENVVFHES